MLPVALARNTPDRADLYNAHRQRGWRIQEEEVAMLLGLDSYSLRWQGWDAYQFLDYASRLGLDNVQFSERANLASHDPGYLRELKAHADGLGVRIEVGMGSFDQHAASFRPEFGSGEEQLGGMLQVAAALSSPVVRCFLG